MITLTLKVWKLSLWPFHYFMGTWNNIPYSSFQNRMYENKAPLFKKSCWVYWVWSWTLISVCFKSSFMVFSVEGLISCWEHSWTLIYPKWWWADCENMSDLQYSVNKGLFWTLWREKNTQTFLRLRWWRQHYYDYCKKWNKNIRLLQCLFNVKIIKSPQNGVCFNFGRVIFTQDEENKTYFQSCLNYVFTNMSTSLREHEDNRCYSTCP